MKKSLQKSLGLFVFLLGMVGSALAQGAQMLPLVAETDFSCSDKDSMASFAAIGEVNGFGRSYFTPTLSTPLNVVTSTKSTTTESDFLSKMQYAVTSNPIRLDSLRFFDNENNGIWGFVVSGKNIINEPILSFNVSGVKNGGKYRIEIDICNPLSKDYLETSGSAPQPHLSASYQSMIRVGVNNTSTSQGTLLNAIPNKAGECITQSVSSPISVQQDLRPISGNKLTVNIYIGQMAEGEALMIKSIRVYAETEPTISGPNEACINGKSIKLTANNIGKNSTIQWYRNNVKISGAAGQTLFHIPGDAAGTFKYYCRVNIPSGDIIQSKEYIVNDIICCIDETGKAISRRLVWQEDFGTFTSDSTYWTWNYSDLNAPKKVTHNDGKKWTSCYDLVIPGTVCDTAPSEGKFTVAGNVTSIYTGATEGTQWEWEAMCFNGKYPMENNSYSFVPDHTYQGSDFGGMLFINGGNKAGDVIYSKGISSSILKGQNVTARCHVNNFSDAVNPVKIQIQLTDMKTGNVAKSTEVTRYSNSDGIDWKQASVSSFIEGDSILIQIINVVGGNDYNEKGNDLILDDIQLLLCDDSRNPDTTGILANYAPTIEGDTIRCSYETSVYRLSEKAPEGCEYYWSKDRGPFTKGGDSCIVKTANNDVASTHRLTCRIISPDEDEVTVSINYETIGVGLSLKVESDPEDISKKSFTAIAESPKHVQKYYWIVNGQPLSIEDLDLGAGPINLKFDDEGSLVEVYTISTHGCKSDTVSSVIDSRPTCEDENGNKTPQTLIWQEDFGTFTSDSTYWTWDYSDLNAPKKVTHNDGKKWTSCYGLEIPGTVCDTAPFIEGKYTVAGNVTCSYDGVNGGTQWGWEAICFNGKYPRENGYTFVPDHTYQGSDFGGMLFINGGNEAGDVIYSKQIKSSKLKGKNVTARCFVNTFADAPNPVEIYIRVTDTKSGVSVSSNTVTRNTQTDGLAWFVADASNVIEGDEVLIEVVDAIGSQQTNVMGNDLILDDIQLFVCDTPELEGVETQPAEYMDELVNVYTISGIIIKTNVKRSEALNGLKKGTYYIVGHEKVLVDL